MASEKARISGWRSRFGKKSAEGLRTQDDALSEKFDIRRKRPSDGQFHQGQGVGVIKGGPSYGINDAHELAAQHIARQQRAVSDDRFGSRITLASGVPNDRSARASLNTGLEGGASSSSMPRSKLERMMGGGGDGGAERGPMSRPRSSAGSRVDQSDAASMVLDLEETACPVCLELLSFRLAGERPHVTPSCGHSLHHACFTAVYGPPEAILAAQDGPGRAPPPGMCGVCRRLIVLGDEPESKRQTKLAGMMGVADTHRGPGGPGRSGVGYSRDGSSVADDPLEGSHSRHRSRDILRTLNGNYSAITVGSPTSIGKLPLSSSLSVNNDEEISQKTMRNMLHPTVKIRPEYDTLYRKDSSDVGSKQNVVCVISIDVPSRRAWTGVDEGEEELLWTHKSKQHGQDSSLGDNQQASPDNDEVEDEVEQQVKARKALTIDERDEDRRASVSSSDAEEEGFSFGATPAAGSASLDPFANIVDDLSRRISDWKGHTIDKFGPLILFDFLGVRQDSIVREFYVYLFREALLCVTEDKRKDKGLARLMGSDKTSNGSHHFDELNLSNGGPSSGRLSKPALKLKGRIWLRHIRRCQDSDAEPNAYCLSITLDDDSLDHFVLCFRERGHREMWKEKLGELLEQHKKADGSGANVPGRKKSASSSSQARSPIDAQPETLDESNRPANTVIRRYTAASISGASVKSGKSGSNNLTASPSVTGSLRSFGQQVASSPRTDQSSINEQSKAHSLPTRGSAPSSVVPNLPQHQQWSASGGLDPNISPPDMLPHTPLDLIIMVSVPSLTAHPAVSSSTVSSSAALKLRLIRSTLDYIVSHLGGSDRIAFVAYNVGVDGPVRKTPLLNPSKEKSREKLDLFVDTIGKPWDGPGADPFLEDLGRLGGSSDRTDTVTAVNVGLDIVLQRKSKNPVTGMLLINDTPDAPRRGQMDLVMARAEAANVPVHCFGFGKSHDPTSLWLISTNTRGSYTFVKEWYQLRECVTGCVGALMSVALTDVKLHISVPSDNFFKIRRIKDQTGAIIASSGKDVDISLGDLRFGECKELFAELELDFGGLLRSMKQENVGRGLVTSRKPVSEHYEKGSATDDFVQRLGLGGLSLGSTADQTSPTASNDHASMSADFIEEIAVLEVDCGCKDPSLSSTTTRLPTPAVLTLEVDGNTPDPLSEASGGSPALAAAMADPIVMRRRMEILVSEMITRCLLLVSRRNYDQALTVLLDTRRIVNTVLPTIPTGGELQHRDNVSSPANRETSATVRSTHAKKQKQALHRKTALSLMAMLEDLDVLIEGLETNQGASFERTERNFGAQQAMALRDQRAWTSRTDTEWQFLRNIDNASAFASQAATYALAGSSR